MARRKKRSTKRKVSRKRKRVSVKGHTRGWPKR